MAMSIDLLIQKGEVLIGYQLYVKKYRQLITSGKGGLGSPTDEPPYWLSNMKCSALKPRTHKNQNRVSRFISVTCTYICVYVCVRVSVGVFVIIKVKERGLSISVSGSMERVG